MFVNNSINSDTVSFKETVTTTNKSAIAEQTSVNPTTKRRRTTPGMRMLMATSSFQNPFPNIRTSIAKRLVEHSLYETIGPDNLLSKEQQLDQLSQELILQYRETGEYDVLIHHVICNYYDIKRVYSKLGDQLSVARILEKIADIRMEYLVECGMVENIIRDLLEEAFEIYSELGAEDQKNAVRSKLILILEKRQNLLNEWSGDSWSNPTEAYLGLAKEFEYLGAGHNNKTSLSKGY